MTSEQEDYFTEAAKEKAKEYLFGEVDKMFGQLARRHSGSKYFRIEHKPIRYRAKPARPRYRELDVDSELVCADCDFAFQVYGIFGFCPGCCSENLRVYDANLAIILQEVSSSPNPERALRHAYSDLVSTFEHVCTKRAATITSKTTDFQDMYGSRKFFKKQTGVDMFDGLSESKKRALQRVFQKRHVYEHSEGIIGDRYVRKMPEDTHLLGTKAELSTSELMEAVETLREVLDKLVQATT